MQENLSSTSRVFEWGSGGSTLFLLRHAAEVCTVEHDEGWFVNVQNSVQKAGFKNWNGQLILPEISGAANNSLDPADWNQFHSGCETLQNCSMKNYVNYIQQYPEDYFDIIIVDGRARPSCLFHAWEKLKPNGLLFLDNAEVDYYAPICKLLTENCDKYYSFAGAGPYISSFWLTCAWRRPLVHRKLSTAFVK